MGGCSLVDSQGKQDIRVKTNKRCDFEQVFCWAAVVQNSDRDTKFVSGWMVCRLTQKLLVQM